MRPKGNHINTLFATFNEQCNYKCNKVTKFKSTKLIDYYKLGKDLTEEPIVINKVGIYGYKFINELRIDNPDIVLHIYFIHLYTNKKDKQLGYILFKEEFGKCIPVMRFISKPSKKYYSVFDEVTKQLKD